MNGVPIVTSAPPHQKLTGLAAPTVGVSAGSTARVPSIVKPAPDSAVSAVRAPAPPGAVAAELTSGRWTVTRSDDLTIDDCAPILTSDALTLLRAEEGADALAVASDAHSALMGFLLRKERLSLARRTAEHPATGTCGTELDLKTAPLDSQAAGGGTASLKVGGFLDDFTVYFWRNAATITFYIDGATFPSQDAFSRTERAFALSALAWSLVLPAGTRFVRVYEAAAANYMVRFRAIGPVPTVLASASPPAFYRLGERNITVYGFALQAANVDILANVMAHEMGHVVGLRHSFAQTREAELESGAFYDDPTSVMSYQFPPLINVNDVQNTRTLYDVMQDGRAYYLQFRGQWTVFQHVRVDP